MMEFNEYKTAVFRLREGKMISPVNHTNYQVQWAHLVIRDEFGRVKKLNKQVGKMRKGQRGWFCECEMSTRSVGDVVEFGSKRFKTKDNPKDIIYGVVLEIKENSCMLGLAKKPEIAFEDSASVIEEIEDPQNVSLGGGELDPFISAVKKLKNSEAETALCRFFILGCKLHFKGASMPGRNACSSAMRGAGMDKDDPKGFRVILEGLPGNEAMFVREVNAILTANKDLNAGLSISR